MIFNRTISILAFICFCRFLAGAQSGSIEPATKQELVAAYQKACSWFINTPGYYFKLKYASYKDYVSKEPIESSEGYYKRAAGKYITEAMGIKTMQNSAMKVEIDTADKIITVTDPGNLSPAMASAEEMEALLDNIKALKKIKHLKSISYRIDFNKNDQYEAYEFTVSDKGMIERVSYYYTEQTERKDNGITNKKITEIKMKPRLEISFSGYQVPAKYIESEFSEESIFIKDRTKLKLTSMYKDFRILDYRLQTRK